MGLLGEPSVRTFGAYSIYLSLRVPHRIRIGDGSWQSSALSIVPPQVPHRIMSGERMICNVLIEAETVAPAALPAFLQERSCGLDTSRLWTRMRCALEAFERSDNKQFACTEDFDRAFLGEVLVRRGMDPRIDRIVAHIKRDPNQTHSAQECAAMIHVSVSRFLHLFKAEVGVPFRNFRTWLRARSVLYFVTQTANLASIALDIGYPDSTHFSHSIRNVFGLTPKSIFAGCRKLELYAGVVRA